MAAGLRFGLSSRGIRLRGRGCQPAAGLSGATSRRHARKADPGEGQKEPGESLLAYTNDEMTAHGFRAMARTVMPKQLAHAESGPPGAADDCAQFMEMRRAMM